MSSTRAADVAEVLWEIKRADKVATYSTIAERAGFSAGTNGRAVVTALKTVRKDWPHLQWYRAISDELIVERGSEQETLLREAGIELADGQGNDETVAITEDYVMSWNGKSDGEEA